MSEEKENLEVTSQSTEKKKFELTPKAKKILNIVVDVVCGAILLFALLLAICTIRSKAKGYSDYTEIFGKAYIAASSGSMDADKPEWVPEGKLSGFKEGDLITIKTLSAAEVKKLEVGDVITFRSGEIVKEKWVLNTHRIKTINYENGEVVSFTTQGDANPRPDNPVNVSNVIGVYQSKAGGIGRLFLFMNSSTGFFVCIVLPTLIVVAYCVVNLILVVRKEKKVQTAAAIDEKDAERERIRAELLAEMQANTNAPAENQESATEPAEKSEEQPKAVAVAEEVKENKAEDKVEAPVEDKAEEVKPEPAEEKAKEEKPAEKKASTTKTTTKSASTKTASTKTTATKSAAKPASTKTTGTKTAAKKTDKSGSEE